MIRDAQQPAIKPSSPTVVAPPAWSRVMNMPDGRLRTKGKTDAIVIVTDGQPVGIMMPLQPPSK